MTVLITGGCGFIGSNLVKHLLRAGTWNIQILDNLSTGDLAYLKEIAESLNARIIKEDDELVHHDEKSILLIEGDIRDKEVCLKACRGVDCVVHLAAHAGVIPSIENPYYDFEVNILGTLNLLKAGVKNNVEKFIFASSNAPLGNQNPPMNETKVPRPLSPYGASKLACEAYCSAFYHSYGLKTISLRFSNVYGPYSLHKNSVVAKFIKDAIVKKKLTIYGDGKQTRDLVYVDDLCRAIFTILGSTKEIVFGDVFNLGTGRETSVLWLAEYIKSLVGDKIKIKFEKERCGEIKRNYSDIGKAKAWLGFNPEVSIKDGVKQVYEWFRSQGVEKISASRVLSGSE